MSLYLLYKSMNVCVIISATILDYYVIYATQREVFKVAVLIELYTYIWVYIRKHESQSYQHNHL